MGRDFPYLDEHERFRFPPLEQASVEGVLGVGGNLSPGMLLSAYSQGIFPWYSENEPILWWSPHPRFVLFPKELHVPKSMRRIMNKGIFSFSFDRCFFDIVLACREIERPEQDGTWITDDMLQAYTRLHELGYAHSLEVWEETELAGGLYGVSLGSCFFGESMFHYRKNASKAGFIHFCRVMRNSGISMIDSQVHTEHLERFGARYVHRDRYKELLNEALQEPSYIGRWKTVEAEERELCLDPSIRKHFPL